MQPQFETVVSTDFDAMVAIRIAALRESLERLERFAPVRATGGSENEQDRQPESTRATTA
jgi:hypothetical protein